MTATTAGSRTGTVQANGIDIHYIEAGSPDSPDLVLLHGGLISTNPLCDVTPVSYGAHLGALAERFHVIAPDQRGCGLTPHTGSAHASTTPLAPALAAPTPPLAP